MEHVRIGEQRLAGDLQIPDAPSAVIVFVHGSGSSRLSPRNRYVAKRLNRAGKATEALESVQTVPRRRIRMKKKPVWTTGADPTLTGIPILTSVRRAGIQVAPQSGVGAAGAFALAS